MRAVNFGGEFEGTGRVMEGEVESEWGRETWRLLHMHVVSLGDGINSFLSRRSFRCI